MTRPTRGRPSTGRPPATGPACAPPLHWPSDDGLNFLRLDHPAPFNVPVLGGRQRGVRELGDRPPHRAARPGHVHRVRQAVRRPTPRTIDPSISIGIDVGSPGRLVQQLDPPTSSSNRSAQGFTLGFISDHNYVQAPGSESDSTLLLGHRSTAILRHRQPLRLGRASDRLREPAQSIPRRGRQQRPAAGDRVQLGLLQPGQADDQPGQRPVRGRLARRAAARRRTTAPTSGTCATAMTPATTIRRASTAGARGAITA